VLVISDLFFRLRVLFRRKSVEAELDEELRAHLERQVEKYVRLGLTLQEAERRARLEFGGLEKMKEECRDARGVNFLENTLKDARYGLRMLVKDPGFTAVAVLTLALGIGANTAIFSMINAILLRPLPVHDPHRLIFLGFERPGLHNFDTSFSYPEFEETSRQVSEVFAAVTGMKFGGVAGGLSSPDGLTVEGETKPIEPVFVTGNFFKTLGIQPYLGRFILPSEGKVAGADPVLVLSYEYWASRFRRDPGILGKKASFNGRPVTIVGIAPKGFFGVTPIVEAQGYLPLGMALLEDVPASFVSDPKVRHLLVLARQRRGVSREQAQAVLQIVGQRLLERYPRHDDEKILRAYRLRPPGLMSGPNPFPKLIALLLTLAGMVLILACVNVANLLLARSVLREREMAVRAALGAGRGRLLRQILTESLLLALFGCVAGILAGSLVTDVLQSLRLPTQLPVVLDFHFDWRVFGYTSFGALVAGVLVGIPPALRISRRDLQRPLQETVRRVVGGRLHLPRVLVAVQLGGSLTLLIVAALFVRSLKSAQHADLGFAAERVVNLTLAPHEIGLNREQGSNFYRDVLDGVRTLPGVQSASLALAVPMGDAVYGDSLRIPGYQVRQGAAPPSALYNAVSPGFFKTLRIALTRGRDISEADDESAPRVAVINEAMADKFWPHQNPVGRHFTMESNSGQSLEVIGVVKNTRITTISGPFESCFYLPLAQHYAAGATLQFRIAYVSNSLPREVMKLIDSLVPGVPILRVQTMQETVGGMNGLYIFKLGANLTGALGLLGLTLAMVGVFGLTSYVVTQRTQEIGVRIALGAQKGDLLRMVIGQGFKMAVVGVAGGIAGALGLTRFLSSMLYDVKPTDPLTFIVVSLVLIAVALCACYIPARRATKVDPMVALRYE
jgi:putative ABC transport system permease protein